MTRKHLLVGFLLCFVLISGYSVDFIGTEGSAGLIWIGNMEAEGSPSAVKPIVSISTLVDTGKSFDMEPTVSVTGLLYEFADTDLKPVPTSAETGDSAYFLSLMFDPGVHFSFPVGDYATFSAITSAAILLRIPLIGYGDENVRDARATGSETNRADMTWYMHAGRFLYPRIGMKLSRELTVFTRFRGAELTGSVDTYWPWLNLFINEEPEQGPRFLDQMMIRIAVGLRFSGNAESRNTPNP